MGEERRGEETKEDWDGNRLRTEISENPNQGAAYAIEHEDIAAREAISCTTSNGRKQCVQSAKVAYHEMDGQGQATLSLG